MCDKLDKAVRDYIIGNGTVGQAIIGPYNFQNDNKAQTVNVNTFN